MNTQFNKSELSLYLSLGMVLLISRLIPHPPNFTASIAALVFAAISLRSWFAILSICLFYWIADLILNNGMYSKGEFQWLTGHGYWIYIPMILSFVIIRFANKSPMKPLALFQNALFSSVLFFILSNLGVWFHSIQYSKDVSGLTACYVNAIPFFGNELAGTFFYSTLIYAVYWLTDKNHQSRIVNG